MAICGLHATAPAAVGAGAGNVESFPLSYFAEAQPRTAFDLVSRLPGFSIDGGDDDVRGYAGSAGNVLIDGRRPASKYGEIETVLERIPADAVARVELFRGSSTIINMQGNSAVVNVVRRRGAASSLRAMLAAEQRDNDRLRPQLRLEATRTAPGFIAEGSLHLFDVPNDGGAGYRRRVASSGLLQHDATARIAYSARGFSAQSGVELPVSDGELRLSAMLEAARSEGLEFVAEAYPDDAETAYRSRGEDAGFELGIQFGRDIGDGSRAELLVIQQMQRFDDEETEVGDSDSRTFVESGTSGESIIRGTVRSSPVAGRSIEWGGEAAFNFLDSQASATSAGASVDFPESAVDVEEVRGEVFGRLTWTPEVSVTSGLGAAFEVSRISQSGDASPSKLLLYVKPRGSLTWNRTAADRFHVSVERSVGQLDFEDFVSSAELSRDTLNIGNADLEPETSWDFLASWERQLGGDSTASLSLLHSEISGVIDFAPAFTEVDGDGVVTTYESLANIGDGSLSEISLDLNVPLTRFGISGGLLKSRIAYIFSSVRDPVTAERRRISGVEYPWDADIEFSQDLPARRFRWGVSMALGDSEPEFRVDEIRREESQLRVDLFADFFVAADWTLGAVWKNVTGRERTLNSDLYDDVRDVGELAATATDRIWLEPHIRVYAERSFL